MAFSGQFSKRECRHIFPKHTSQLYRDKFNEILNAIDLIASPSCTLDERGKEAYIQQRIDALPPANREETTGLRIDVSFENVDTGECKWVDVTAMHTGAHSYQEKELKALRSRQVTAQLAATLSLPDPLKFESSPGLLERVAAKTQKYSRLLQVAKKQAIEKKRKQAPSFLTFAISDYGEMAPQAVELQEWIVLQYRAKLDREGKRLDGCKPAELVQTFRQQLRLGVQLAIAAGCGEMLRRAGQPWF